MWPIIILPAAIYFSYLYSRHIISSKLVVAITFNDVVYMPLVNKSLFKPRHTSTINFKVVAAFFGRYTLERFPNFGLQKNAKLLTLTLIALQWAKHNKLNDLHTQFKHLKSIVSRDTAKNRFLGFRDCICQGHDFDSQFF